MFKTGSCSSGGAWRTAKRRKRTSYGRNGGPVDREECGVPQNRGNGPPTVETGVLLIGRGVAYRKMDETYLLWSKRGPVHREGCGVPQNETPRNTVHLHRRPPPASTGYYSSTVYCLHGVLLIQHRPPQASANYCSSTGSYSSSLHRSSTSYCSTSPLHGVLFNNPSTGYCSSNPPPATIQQALHQIGRASCRERV